MELSKLINEAEFKVEALPTSYFIEYFERDFLPKLKDIYKQVNLICNQQSDSLPEEELRRSVQRFI